MTLPHCHSPAAMEISNSRSAGSRTDSTESRGWSSEYLVLLAVALLGLLLRWYRLDLISFRYDVAEALFRARETFSLGHPPLTGIVNSLGFRNPGGFIWSILPPVLITPRAETATAWLGLLTLTGVWPLFRIGRRYFHGWFWVLPCITYAVLPSSVFAGRAVWAQNLMPAVGAWALWWILTARDETRPPRTRGIAATAALAILGLSVSIHLSGAAYLIAAMLLLAPAAYRGSLPRVHVAASAAVLALSAAALVPSLLDWQEARLSPQPKPEHVLKFEANMPPPPPPLARAREAVSGQFGLLSSFGFLGGIEQQLGDETILATRAADLGLLLLTVVGIARGLLLLRRENSADGGPAEIPVRRLSEIARVLLVWLAVPAMLGALLISRLNSTYFAPALPAALLLATLPLALPARRRAAQRMAVVIAGILAVVYSWLFFAGMAAVDDARIVHGIYYIPLADQERLAWRFKQAGVPERQIHHLSGEWYQRPYDYLHAEVAGAALPGDDRAWAVMDDQLLRQRSPRRVEWMEEHLPESLGTVRYRIVRSRAEVSELARSFYAVPME